MVTRIIVRNEQHALSVDIMGWMEHVSEEWQKQSLIDAQVIRFWTMYREFPIEVQIGSDCFPYDSSELER